MGIPSAAEELAPPCRNWYRTRWSIPAAEQALWKVRTRAKQGMFTIIERPARAWRLAKPW